MKKLLALLTLAALLMTTFVCPTLAESPMTGGWSTYTDDPTEIPAEALDALNAALEELVGCVYNCAAGDAGCRGHELLLPVRNDRRCAGCSAELRAGLRL